jgi:ESAT-6 family protein
VGVLTGMGVVHATQDQIVGMAHRCDETASVLSRGMAGLIASIEGLGGSGLQGRANVALQNTSQHLHHGMATITQALTELAGKMSSASRQIGSHDEDVAGQIRSVGTGHVASSLRG